MRLALLLIMSARAIPWRSVAKYRSSWMHQRRSTGLFCVGGSGSQLQAPPRSLQNASTAEGGPADVILPPRDRRSFMPFTLANGLQLMIISDPDTDMAAASVNLHVGHFGDPAAMAGLAHFHEHMLFLGTEEFPVEGDYEKFLSENGGSSNAWTGTEDTNYYFHVKDAALEGALQRFSSFFKTPLLSEDAAEREMRAVDSEHKNNLPADNWRSFQLLKSLAAPDHPLAKFGTGNYETLCPRDASADGSSAGDKRPYFFPEGGRDPVSELRAFNRRHYHASNMRVAVLSRRPMEELVPLVEQHFSGVPQAPEGDGGPAEGAFFPFEGRLGRRVEAVPVRELRRVELLFPMPPAANWRRNHAYRLFSHVLGHEGPRSLHALLRKRGWARGLSAGTGLSIEDCVAFKLSVELTELGEQHVEEVVDLLYGWARAGASLDMESLGRIFEEEKSLSQSHFDWAEKANPEDVASGVANALQYYAAPMVLQGPRVAAAFDEAAVRDIQRAMDPEHSLLIVTRKAFEGPSQLKGSAHVEAPTGDGEPRPPEQPWKKELWYGTVHRDTPHAPEDLERWRSPLPEALGLAVDAGKNAFLVDDFTVAGDTAPPAPPSALEEASAMVAAASGGAPEQQDVLRALRPVVLSSGASHRVWHKLDRSFLVPRSSSAFYLLTEELYKSPGAFLAGRLFARLLLDRLNEGLYDARLAGLGYTFSATRSGLLFRVSGYSQRLGTVVDALVDAAAELLEEMEREAPPAHLLSKFAEERESILKDYRNFGKGSPASLSSYHISQLLSVGVHAASEYNATLLLEPEAGGLGVRRVAQEMRSALQDPNLRLDAIFCGSVTADDAAKAAERFAGRLSKLSPSASERISEDLRSAAAAPDVKKAVEPGAAFEGRAVTQSVRLPEGAKSAGSAESVESVESAKSAESGKSGKNTESTPASPGGETYSALRPSVVLESTTRNAEEKNCALQVVWQLRDGDASHSSDAAASLLSQLAHTSAFSELRTKQQLGYAVSVGLGRSGASALRLTLSVTSSAVPEPRELERRVAGWLESFRQELQEMEEDTFRRHVDGIIAAVLERDGRLAQDSSRVEGEVGQGTYEFYRKLQHCSAARGLEKADVLRLFDDFVALEGRKRRVLVSRTFSQAAEKEEEAKLPEGPREDEVPVRRLRGIDEIRAYKADLEVYGDERAP